MSNRTRRQLVLLTLILLLPSLSLAVTGTGDRKSFEISRTDTPPIIDGRLDDAVWANAAFVAALELGPDDLNALHQVGVLATKQGDWGSLRYQILDLEQAVARTGRSEQFRRVYHLQGELAIAQGNPKKAHELLAKANGLFPHPLYQDAIARAYLAEENLAEAAATYRAIVESTDQRLDIPVYYVKTLLELAKALDALERSEEAASYYQLFLDHWGKARGSLPGVTDAKKRLGELQAAS